MPWNTLLQIRPIRDILREVRSPVLVFLILLNTIMNIFIFQAVAERRQMDNNVIQKLLDSCFSKATLASGDE